MRHPHGDAVPNEGASGREQRAVSTVATRARVGFQRDQRLGLDSPQRQSRCKASRAIGIATGEGVNEAHLMAALKPFLILKLRSSGVGAMMAGRP